MGALYHKLYTQSSAPEDGPCIEFQIARKQTKFSHSCSPYKGLSRPVVDEDSIQESVNVERIIAKMVRCKQCKCHAKRDIAGI